MATLPTPGGDTGNWGDELNEFLRVSHLDNGNLRVADGQVLTFGTTLDVTLYRPGANALKTDDSFDAAVLRVAGVDIDTVYSKITDLSAHVAAADPHTGYQRETEKGAVNGYASLDASALIPDTQIPPSIARDTEVTAAVSAHAALADPHTGYQKETEKGVANGYASLDGSGVVPDAQIPAAIARDAEVTSAISTHAAAADPHTGYQKESEKGVANGYAPLDATSKVPVANLPTILSTGCFKELSYNQITADVQILSTTAAGATTIITATSVTADGSATHLIEFWMPGRSPGNFVHLALFDGSTLLCEFTPGNVTEQALHFARQLVPSAASHTYSVRAWSDANPFIKAGSGSGGEGTYAPAWIRISQRI